MSRPALVPVITVGQVWVEKRGIGRRVKIEEVELDRVQVRRSTSRRTQPISVATLTRKYRLASDRRDRP